VKYIIHQNPNFKRCLIIAFSINHILMILSLPFGFILMTELGYLEKDYVLLTLISLFPLMFFVFRLILAKKASDVKFELNVDSIFIFKNDISQKYYLTEIVQLVIDGSLCVIRFKAGMIDRVIHIIEPSFEFTKRLKECSKKSVISS